MQVLYRAVFFLLFYWLLRQSANLLEVEPHVSAFFPAPAAGVALIAVFGVRCIPLYFLGIIASSLPQQFPWEFGTVKWLLILEQLVVYGGMGAVLNRYGKRIIALQDSTGVLSLVGLYLGGSLISGLLAREIFKNHTTVPDESLWDAAIAFWVGDAGGLIIVGPVVMHAMLLFKKGRLKDRLVGFVWRKLNKLEFGIVAVVTAVMSIYLADHLFYPIEHLEYMCLIPVVIGSAKMGFFQGYLAVMLSNFLLVFQVQFAGEVHETAIELQIFFIVLTVVAMLVGVEFDKRRVAPNA